VPTDVPVQEPLVGKKMSRKDMRMLRYGNLCNDFAKIAVDMAASDKTKEIADKHMKAMVNELALMKKADADALKRRKKSKLPVGSEQATNIMQRATMEKVARLAENREAQDPPVTTTKGRPGQKRKKGGLQLQKQKPRSTKCAVCNEPGHDAKECPVRLANPEMYPMLSLFQ
jgi:hypothetical protein